MSTHFTTDPSISSAPAAGQLPQPQEAPVNPGCQPSPVPGQHPLVLDSILAPMDPGTQHTPMPGQLLWSSFPAGSHKSSLLACHSTTLAISDPASRLVPIVSGYQLILWLQAPSSSSPSGPHPFSKVKTKTKDLLLFTVLFTLFLIFSPLSSFYDFNHTVPLA